MSEELAKVKDQPHLLKDTRTGAIVNTDYRGLQSYKARKRAAAQVKNTSERLEKLESQMGQILELLQQALKR